MPPKLTPEAIAGTLDELAVFAETSAATLAARSGTDMLSSLRQLHSGEEQRFSMLLYNKNDRFKEAHRRQVADAYAHVAQARAAAAAPAVRAASAARTRPQDLRAAAAASWLPAGPASAAPDAPKAAARKRPRTSPEPNASSHVAAAPGTASLAQWRRR